MTTSLAELQKVALALRQQILDDLDAEGREREEHFYREVKRATLARHMAEQAAKVAKEEAKVAKEEAKVAAQAAKLAARAALPPRYRKRAPGANYEISGRPAHLAPGSTYRRVEGSRRHSPGMMLTRSQAKKTGSVSAHTRKNRRGGW